MVREKLKILFNSMEWVGFSTSQPWRAYNVKFNKYFNYPEKDIRAGTLLAFYGMLQQWIDDSSLVFGFYDDQKHAIFSFEEYILDFLNYADEIAEEFPGIYGSIGYALKDLDNEIRFEARFPSIDPAIFEEMRKALYTDKVLSGEWESKFYEDAFMEVGLGREYM